MASSSCSHCGRRIILIDSYPYWYHTHNTHRWCDTSVDIHDKYPLAEIPRAEPINDEDLPLELIDGPR